MLQTMRTCLSEAVCAVDLGKKMGAAFLGPQLSDLHSLSRFSSSTCMKATKAGVLRAGIIRHIRGQVSKKVHFAWDSGKQGTHLCRSQRFSHRPLESQYNAAAGQPNVLAHELVQGPLVKWSTRGSISRPPPTCVLVHGIMGCRRNMLNLALRLTRAFSSWQFLLVDLRCHGDSAYIQTASRSNSVESAAADVLELLRHLRLFPEVLIGHSFGGKVVMSMADQFGRIGPRLPRPVQVWVLDAQPGSVMETASRPEARHRQDHPQDLIAILQGLPLPIESRAALQNYLLQQGFSLGVASWVTSNLRPSQDDPRECLWIFDLKGIEELYRSYETQSFWPFLSAPTQGIRVNFVRAQYTSYNWNDADLDRLAAYGHCVHTLSDAGHWLHTDNPEGLLDILRPAFTGSPWLS